MDTTWMLFAKFLAITACGAILGVLIYRIVNRNPWHLTARVAGGIAGSALGTFCAGLCLLAYSLEGSVAGIVALLFAAGGAILFQRKMRANDWDPLDFIQ
jgi:hypothetical protein